MKKYFMIMSVALCCITGSSCFAQDTMSEEQKTAYGNILWQFWDAIQSNGSSEHLIEESVVNYVFLRYPIREDRQLAFSVTDMNEDGSMELMIGYQDTASVVNLFSFKDGKVVQLLEAMEERWHTNFCANGWLDYEGSGGAAYHSSIYYSIGQDGKSLKAEEYYSINGEEKYVEDLEGNYIQFNGEYDQYMEKYETQIPEWIPLTYDNISEVTVPYENAGGRLTVYDIPAAPQFRNGVCINGEEVLIRYKKNHISRDISENWRCEYNYEEYGEEVQTYQIKDRQTNNLISTDVVNLRNGEVEETDARSGEVRRFNMFGLTSDSMEIIEGTDAGESYDNYAALVSHYENLYGELGQTVLFDWMDCLTGVCALELIDFDQDGAEELLIVYGQQNEYGTYSYQYEIWGYSGERITKLNSGNTSTSGDGYNYLKIITHDGYEYVLQQDGSIEIGRYYYGYIGDKFDLVRECSSCWDDTLGESAYFIDGVSVSFDELLKLEEEWQDSETAYGFTIKNLDKSIASVEETKNRL